MKEYIYTSKKDNRTRIVIKDDNGNITSKSYPRMLMEQKLGRPLAPNEDVHHIDNDKTNNNIDNLEVQIHGEHQRAHSTKYFPTFQYCDVCGQLFIYSAEQMCRYMSDKSRIKKVKRGITCSKRCAYLLGLSTREQNRRNSIAECGLNGESFPNGNTVPNNLFKSVEEKLSKL